MLYTMSWDTFCGWMEYFRLEPFGDERRDLRTGILASSIVNSIRAIAAGLGGQREYEVANPIDFMPSALREKQEQEAEYDRSEQAAADKQTAWQSFKSTLRMMGKRVTR